MQDSNIIEYVMVGGVALVALGLRKFRPLRFVQVERSRAQRLWGLVSVLVGFLWIIVTAKVGKGILTGSLANHLYLVLGVAVVAVLGIAILWLRYRWLMEADEMIRRIETEALALGFGVSTVGLIAADQLRSAGIGFDTSDSIPGMYFFVLFFLSYGIWRVVVYLKYR